jgi:uncharacterized membrane protein YccC
MKWLWLLLPDEALVLLIALVGVGLMIGLLRRRAAVRLLGLVILLLVAAPFFELVLDLLPWWLVLGLGIVVLLGLFRDLFELLLGKHAAAEAIGSLAADVIRFGFRLLFLPFRVLWWVLRRA